MKFSNSACEEIQVISDNKYLCKQTVFTCLKILTEELHISEFFIVSSVRDLSLEGSLRVP